MHTTLTQHEVNYIIRIVAGASGVSFEAARDDLMMRWANMARERIVQGLASYEMWEDMVEMARKAVL